MPLFWQAAGFALGVAPEDARPKDPQFDLGYVPKASSAHTYSAAAASAPREYAAADKRQVRAYDVCAHFTHVHGYTVTRAVLLCLRPQRVRGRRQAAGAR